MPVQSWADVFTRLAVAAHWNSPPSLGDPAYPDCSLNDDETHLDERALAHVVRSVLDLTGLVFDRDGRLIFEPAIHFVAPPPCQKAAASARGSQSSVDGGLG